MTSKPEPELPVRRSQLTARQWAEAETLWVNGDVTYEDLGKRFSKHPDTFKKRFHKKGLKKGANAAMHKERIAAAINGASVADVTVLAARIKESKERHYKMASGIASLTWAEILNAKKENIPLSAVAGNLKALDIAASAIKKAREETWAVLGLDKGDNVDDDELPELVISELTAAQIETLHTLDDDEGVFADNLVDTTGADEEETDDDVESES